MYRYVARDKDGKLHLFFSMYAIPRKYEDRWVLFESGWVEYIPNDNLDQVKWEDDNPISIELSLKVL